MIPTKVRRPWRGLGLTLVGRVLKNLNHFLREGDHLLNGEDSLDHIAVGRVSGEVL